MKTTKFAILALGLALMFAVTGCKHKAPAVTKLPPAPSNNGVSGPADNIGNGGALAGGNNGLTTTMGGGDLANFNPDQMAQDRATLAPQTVYFDYDSATIKAAEQTKLAAVAAALKSDEAAKLLVEGNCDERGTEEYNRSLGERRALAAREALASQGVDAGRIATRSYGKDRPADNGHNEMAWKKNRRDEFVLLHAK